MKTFVNLMLTGFPALSVLLGFCVLCLVPMNQYQTWLQDKIAHSVEELKQMIVALQPDNESGEEEILHLSDGPEPEQNPEPEQQAVAETQQIPSWLQMEQNLARQNMNDMNWPEIGLYQLRDVIHNLERPFLGRDSHARSAHYLKGYLHLVNGEDGQAFDEFIAVTTVSRFSDEEHMESPLFYCALAQITPMDLDEKTSRGKMQREALRGVGLVELLELSLHHKQQRAYASGYYRALAELLDAQAGRTSRLGTESGEKAANLRDNAADARLLAAALATESLATYRDWRRPTFEFHSLYKTKTLADLAKKLAGESGNHAARLLRARCLIRMGGLRDEAKKHYDDLISEIEDNARLIAERDSIFGVGE